MARLISKQEAARILDVHPQTVANWFCYAFQVSQVPNLPVLIDRFQRND